MCNNMRILLLSMLVSTNLIAGTFDEYHEKEQKNDIFKSQQQLVVDQTSVRIRDLTRLLRCLQAGKENCVMPATDSAWGFERHSRTEFTGMIAERISELSIYMSCVKKAENNDDIQNCSDGQ